MNNEIKVSLTIELPGATMVLKENCLKTIQKEVTKKDKSGKIYKKTTKIQAEDWDKMDKNVLDIYNNKELKHITYFTRKTKPAIQSINITKEGYNSMTSDGRPEWYKGPINWNNLSKKQRLEKHLNVIAEYLGGKVSSYQIFEE